MGCLGHPGLTIQVERAPCSRECSAPTAAHRVAPSGAWQNGFAERLIGSIRRECLDHFVVWGETHLRRILRTHARYYNEIRTHWSLDKDAPVFRPIQRTGIISSHAILGGLHHYYCLLCRAHIDLLRERQIMFKTIIDYAGIPPTSFR